MTNIIKVKFFKGMHSRRPGIYLLHPGACDGR